MNNVNNLKKTNISVDKKDNIEYKDDTYKRELSHFERDELIQSLKKELLDIEKEKSFQKGILYEKDSLNNTLQQIKKQYEEDVQFAKLSKEKQIMQIKEILAHIENNKKSCKDQKMKLQEANKQTEVLTNNLKQLRKDLHDLNYGYVIE